MYDIKLSDNYKEQFNTRGEKFLKVKNEQYSKNN